MSLLLIPGNDRKALFVQLMLAEGVVAQLPGWSFKDFHKCFDIAESLPYLFAAEVIGLVHGFFTFTDIESARIGTPDELKQQCALIELLGGPLRSLSAVILRRLGFA